MKKNLFILFITLFTLQVQSQDFKIKKDSLLTIEDFKRQFDKKRRKIKADNFPISGTAISFGGSFFVSDENFEREHKIGLTTSRLDIIKTEVDALLNEQ